MLFNTLKIPPLSTVKQRFHWDANEVVASLSVLSGGLLCKPHID